MDLGGLPSPHSEQQNNPDQGDCSTGGAIQTVDGTSTMQNCTFSYNNAGQLGGALSQDGTSAHVEECTFTGVR